MVDVKLNVLGASVAAKALGTTTSANAPPAIREMASVTMGRILISITPKNFYSSIKIVQSLLGGTQSNVTQIEYFRKFSWRFPRKPAIVLGNERENLTLRK